jgi:hypothetical protein
MTDQRYACLDRVTVPGGHQEILDVGAQNPLRGRARFSDRDRLQDGGHLGAGLGSVELAVALHYVFNTPYDKLVWDVGHQAYPHKILTGRKERLRHDPPARGTERLPQEIGERIRHVRRGSRQHGDLRCPGNGGRRELSGEITALWRSSATGP